VAAGSSAQARCNGNADIAAQSCTANVGAASPCAEDRRITRSKKALRQALISLMEEKGFDAKTITQADIDTYGLGE